MSRHDILPAVLWWLAMPVIFGALMFAASRLFRVHDRIHQRVTLPPPNGCRTNCTCRAYGRRNSPRQELERSRP